MSSCHWRLSVWRSTRPRVSAGCRRKWSIEAVESSKLAVLRPPDGYSHKEQFFNSSLEAVRRDYPQLEDLVLCGEYQYGCFQQRAQPWVGVGHPQASSSLYAAYILLCSSWPGLCKAGRAAAVSLQGTLWLCLGYKATRSGGRMGIRYGARPAGLSIVAQVLGLDGLLRCWLAEHAHTVLHEKVLQ